MNGGPEPLPSSLLLDLVAAVLQAGLPPAAAVEAVARALDDIGDERARVLLRAARTLDPGDDGPPAVEVDPSLSSGATDVAALLEGLRIAVRAGAAPGAMVRRAAVMQRRRQRVEQQRALRRVEVWVVAPAALCWLPAFVLVGVVPLLLDLVLG